MRHWTLAELARMCGADVEGDASRVVEGPASLVDAGPREVSFFADRRYRSEFLATRAAGVLVPRGTAREGAACTLLHCDDPSAAFNRLVGAFHEPEPESPPGVHPQAWVDPSAELGPEVHVGPGCSVGPGCVLAAGVRLVAGVHLGARVRVGERTVLHPGVVVYSGCAIGAHCLVHAGAVIGADGFGFEPVRQGWRKIPQVGSVLIGDEVEIGANSAIDRGRFGATRIGRGTKIDNLVHVAHNVVVGESVLLIAQAGIAGSARIEGRAIVAGQAGVPGHVTIGAGARIGGHSGVFGDIPAGEDWIGYPARPRHEALRSLAALQKLPERLQRLRELDERVRALEGRMDDSQTGKRT